MESWRTLRPRVRSGVAVVHEPGHLNHTALILSRI